MIVRTDVGTNVVKTDEGKFEVRVLKLPVKFDSISHMVIADLYRLQATMRREQNPKLYDLIQQEITLLNISLETWDEK